MIIDGHLDKFPVKIEYDAVRLSPGFLGLRDNDLAVNLPLIKIILGLVYFPWDALSPLQQDSILEQIYTYENSSQDQSFF
jgi:hypothetical protein